MASTFKLKDSDGRIYTAIDVPGLAIDAKHLQSSSEPFIGLGTLRLDDGRILTQAGDDDTFRIVLTGEVLTRVKT